MYKVLMLDNFDSFTYNLVSYLELFNCKVVTVRNDQNPKNIKDDFDLMVISPGPGTPTEAGFLMEYIRKFYLHKPIFGVCLGMQAINIFFGGDLRKLQPVHGKPCPITHNDSPLFYNIKNPMMVGRYHSLGIDQLGQDLEIIATTNDEIPMAIVHRKLPIMGVQFHPESILTTEHDSGMQLIENVLKLLLTETIFER